MRNRYSKENKEKKKEKEKEKLHVSLQVHDSTVGNKTDVRR